MTKIEQITREAQALSEFQQEAALEFIRAMKDQAFFYSAPPEAHASIVRGLAEADSGTTMGFEEVERRLTAAAKSKSK